MENLIKHFNSIDTSFRKMKFVTVLALVSAVIIAVGSVAASGWFMEKANGTIYVVDKGSAVMASRTQEDSHRELEAMETLGYPAEYEPCLPLPFPADSSSVTALSSPKPARC